MNNIDKIVIGAFLAVLVAVSFFVGSELSESEALYKACGKDQILVKDVYGDKFCINKGG